MVDSVASSSPPPTPCHPPQKQSKAAGTEECLSAPQPLIKHMGAMQLHLKHNATVDKTKTDGRTPLCRAAGNNHTNQLGGTRELSSTLRYKLLPHMSMAAVKPSLSSPPPPPPPPPGRANHQSGRCSPLTCEFSIASGLEPMPSGWDTISRGISKRASGFNAHHQPQPILPFCTCTFLI